MDVGIRNLSEIAPTMKTSGPELPSASQAFDLRRGSLQSGSKWQVYANASHIGSFYYNGGR